MKQTTKRFLGIAAASALALAATSSAFAYGGFGPGGGYNRMMGGPGGMRGWAGGPGTMMSADPVAFTDQQLDQLKTRLGITAEQEEAWSTYADAVKAKAGLMARHRTAMVGATAVTPQQRQAFREQGWSQMQKVTDAARSLNAVLTPEQQAKAGGLIGPMGPRCAFR